MQNFGGHWRTLATFSHRTMLAKNVCLPRAEMCGNVGCQTRAQDAGALCFSCRPDHQPTIDPTNAARDRACDVRYSPKSGHSSARAACPLCATSGHSALIHRLRLRQFSCAVQDFVARAIELHHVVPPGHRGQAVRDFTVAAAELDGD